MRLMEAKELYLHLKLRDCEDVLYGIVCPKRYVDIDGKFYLCMEDMHENKTVEGLFKNCPLKDYVEEDDD
jgi:hypothetical protein